MFVYKFVTFVTRRIYGAREFVWNCFRRVQYERGERMLASRVEGIRLWRVNVGRKLKTKGMFAVFPKVHQYTTPEK